MIERKNIVFRANPNRVLLRYFFPGNEDKAQRIIERILSLGDDEAKLLLEKVCSNFSHRHKNFEKISEANFRKTGHRLQNEESISQEKKRLIGAYFSMEYSIASAALFNPSIVPHPDQSGLGEGEVRFILSLRATGEGHISSIEFRTGIIYASGEINVDEVSNYVCTGSYLPGNIETDLLYAVKFERDVLLTERILFPFVKSESNGIEDARFVLFTEDTGIRKYYSTYTAYDGKSISIHLIETNDFETFTVHKLSGNESADKGMALFPRKINGEYIMISRQDGENLYIMKSRDLYKWESKELLYTPMESWEYVQVGNCGSPIETEEGWILITHAVGPLRTYVISALLLDLQNPKKIIGYLPEPLLQPNETEREGYVPNVVYSCGALLHRDKIILPYAMSDSAASFAVINKQELLKNFKRK